MTDSVCPDHALRMRTVMSETATVHGRNDTVSAAWNVIRNNVTAELLHSLEYSGLL